MICSGQEGGKSKQYNIEENKYFLKFQYSFEIWNRINGKIAINFCKKLTIQGPVTQSCHKIYPKICLKTISQNYHNFDYPIYLKTINLRNTFDKEQKMKYNSNMCSYTNCYFNVNKWIKLLFMNIKFVILWLFVINNEQTEYNNI